jgi:uncharacterized 2Fe-2S/4Fe-4S cluster protein (DUF4445 family)
LIFQPGGNQGEAPAGTTILDAARMLGVGIENLCGGRQTCAKCRISVSAGHFAKYGINSSAGTSLSAVAPIEAQYREQGVIRAEERLACVACLTGDAVIEIPPEARAQKQVIAKPASNRVMPVAPVVSMAYVEVDTPQLGDRRSDWERLQNALEAQWGLVDLALDTRILQDLGIALRAGDWRTTVILWKGHEVIGIRPGYTDGLYGLAVDIGTTTVAAYLCDLRTGQTLATETEMNPQIAYGEDLMSRVSYGMMNDNGAQKLHRAIISMLNQIAQRAARTAGIAPTDILDMVVVGNTIMHHLFLGIDPVELGGAPFALTIRDALDLKARDLGLRIAPAAYVHTLPCQAGHVGADCMAVALAEAPDQADALTLIVDIGTNAELILGNKHGLWSASSPTGPAFEGAQIRYGQRAAPGAIERVRIDPQTWETRFKVIGREGWSDAGGEPIGATGICGSGIIEAVAEMMRAGVIQPDGRFIAREAPIPAPERLQYDGRKGAFLLASSAQSATGSPIWVTQDDVRAIQLAKAALYAGVTLLHREQGGAPIERILLAGGFGTYIDPKYAMLLGLIPDCALDQVAAVGNSAGDGARMALLSIDARAEAAGLARRIHYVETASDPGFQDAFVAALHIPHATDAFPHLDGLMPVAGVDQHSSRIDESAAAIRNGTTAGSEDPLHEKPVEGRPRRRSKG